jgi:hypothetical protein
MIEHVPGQGEGIGGTQHVRHKQLRVPCPDMLQAWTFNQVVCHLFNWQLTKRIGVSCFGA